MDEDWSDSASSPTDELVQVAGAEVADRFAVLAEPLARAARTALPDVNPIGLARDGTSGRPTSAG